MRSLEFDAAAFEDLAWWVEQDRTQALRIIRIIRETQREPFTGLGKPEPLKPLPGQQSFDFKSLDPLAANATNKTVVTLDAGMVRMAANFLGSDTKDSASIKSLVGNIKAIYVREYEYARPGQYNEADLTPLRAYLAQPPWSKVVESTEGKEISEVYLQPCPAINWAASPSFLWSPGR